MRCSDDMASYLREDYLRHSRDAIKMYEQAVNYDENFNQSRFHLGRVLAQIYSYSEAVKHYTRVINAKPKTQEPKEIQELQNIKMFVHLERGITYLAMDQELRMTALKSQPDNELEIVKDESQ